MSEALVPYVDMQNMAKAIATSGLFGIKTPEQALALMLIAQAEGLHPAIAARDYDIIQGRPAKKSEAMMRAFLLAGGSVQWHELSDTKAEATFSHPQGGTVKLDWTMARAKQAGLGDKDMYRKYPRQMLRARVISEGVRTICPLATSGLYTPEEAEDMADGSPINIETRRRTGHGYTREQLPETAASTFETIPPIPETEPPVHETKPGVYEPKGQKPETGRHPIAPDQHGPWTHEMSENLCRQIEQAQSVQELQLYGEQAKDKRIPPDDRDVMRGLYKIRLKALNSPQPQDKPAAGAQGLGADTAPAQAAEEKPWI